MYDKTDTDEKKLSKIETIELLKEAHAGNQKSREKAILNNVGLVVHQVNNNFKSAKYDKNDLISFGIIGLMKAIDTYDLTRNIEFSTYASKCINNEILMYLRRMEKHKNTCSLDDMRTFIDGKEFKLEDAISSEINIEKDYIDKEKYLRIREIVNELPEKNKKIIMLYFGFYNNKRYTQLEIAQMLSTSQDNISRTITKILEKLRYLFEQEGFGTLSNQPKQRKQRGFKTIYEFFDEYAKQQVDFAISKLPIEEKNLIFLRYGNDLQHPTLNKMDQKQISRFYNRTIPKIKDILGKQLNSRFDLDDCSNKDGLQESYIKLLSMFKNMNFMKLFNKYSEKEVMVVILKLGCINGSYLDSEQISEFLNISVEEVIDITKKVLLDLKENIDAAIKVGMKGFVYHQNIQELEKYIENIL